MNQLTVFLEETSGDSTSAFVSSIRCTGYLLVELEQGFNVDLCT